MDWLKLIIPSAAIKEAPVSPAALPGIDGQLIVTAPSPVDRKVIRVSSLLE
jgi:hypothetical protein